MIEQKENIIQIAFGQFKQYGFKSVTMDDIARFGGISKKTLYEIFVDKDELVLEVVKYMLSENQREVDEILSKKTNAIQKLIDILSNLEKMIKGMNIVCFIDLQRYYPAAFSYLEKHKRDYMLRDIINNLKQGIQEGLYRANIEVDIISAFRLESSNLIFHSTLYNNNKYNISKVNTELFAHYIYGIVSLKGYKMLSKYLEKLHK